MIVDAYVHCSDTKFLPFQAWEAAAATASVDAALLVQHLGELDNRYLASVAARDPDRFKVAALIDPSAEGAADFLEGLLDGRALGVPCVGLRMTRDMLEAGADCLAVLDYFGGTIVLHFPDGIGPNVAFIEGLARKYVWTTLYVPHLGWPVEEGRPSPGWHDAIRRLADIGQIVVGLSSAHYFSTMPYPHEDIRPCFRHIIETIGTERIVWASGFPQLIEEETLEQYVALFSGEFLGLSEKERTDMFFGTASRCWGFEATGNPSEHEGRRSL